MRPPAPARTPSQVATTPDGPGTSHDLAAAAQDLPATSGADPDQAGALSLSELISLLNQLAGRIDMMWQRVLYAHAALAAVMTFFATTPGDFLVPRLVVLFLYTANSIIAWRAFDETYGAMDAAVADVRALHGDGARKGHVLTWALSRSYRRHGLRRAALLAAVWVVVSYLVMYPVVLTPT